MPAEPDRPRPLPEAVPYPLIALGEVEPDGDGFRATGFAPSLRFDLGAPRRPGWYVVELGVEADEQAQVRVRPGFGGAFAKERSSVLKEAAPGRFGGTFKAPLAFSAIEVEPLRRPGRFRLTGFSVRRMGPVAIAAMALAGARSAARKGPRPLMRFLADAVGTVLAPRRFVAFEAAPDAALTPEARYRAFIAAVESRLPAPAPDPTPAPITIVVAAFGAEPAALAATLGSIGRQTRPPRHVRVVGAPASGPGPTVGDAWLPAASEDAGEAVGAALADAAEAILVLTPGDILADVAVAALAEAWTAAPDALALHADEDRLGPDGSRRAPVMKPAWSPELAAAHFYPGGPLLLRGDAVAAVGGPRRGFPGAEAHDLVLRMTERTGTGAVVRLPRVLLHRTGDGDRHGWARADRATARRSTLAAVSEHLGRTDPSASAAPLNDPPLAVRIRRAPPDPLPLVSVIIPTRDRVELLSCCLKSLFEKTDYPALEVLVVDNGSTDPATLRYLAEARADPRLRVLPEPGPFNFAALNNRAAAEATGSVLLLLNNDVEAIEPGWLHEMVALALRPGIGAVGAKLLYPDRTVQHAGVLMGMHGTAGHVDQGAAADAAGHLGRLRLTHEVAAVTAACLAMRRSVYRDLGGLDEAAFAIAFNDLDLCLKARAAGLGNLLAAGAVLIHHESASRGADRDAAKRERYLAEAARFKARWAAEVVDDPYVSPQLDRVSGRFEPRIS
jgi:GT2 family glycosyltransferase